MYTGDYNVITFMNHWNPIHFDHSSIHKISKSENPFEDVFPTKVPPGICHNTLVSMWMWIWKKPKDLTNCISADIDFARIHGPFIDHLFGYNWCPSVCLSVRAYVHLLSIHVWQCIAHTTSEEMFPFRAVGVSSWWFK